MHCGLFCYTRCKSSQQQWLLKSFEPVLEQDDGEKAIPKILYDKQQFTRDISTVWLPPLLYWSPVIHQIQVPSLVFCYGGKLTAACQQQVIAVPCTSCWKRCRWAKSSCSTCMEGWCEKASLKPCSFYSQTLLRETPKQSLFCSVFTDMFCPKKIPGFRVLVFGHVTSQSQRIASAMSSLSVYKAGDTSFSEVFCLQWKCTF